jgi:hypothetical protein
MSFRAWLPIRTIRVGPEKRHYRQLAFHGQKPPSDNPTYQELTSSGRDFRNLYGDLRAAESGLTQGGFNLLA